MLGGVTIERLLQDDIARQRHFSAVQPRPAATRGHPDVMFMTARAKLGDAHTAEEALAWLTPQERLAVRRGPRSVPRAGEARESRHAGPAGVALGVVGAPAVDRSSEIPRLWRRPLRLRLLHPGRRATNAAHMHTAGACSRPLLAVTAASSIALVAHAGAPEPTTRCAAAASLVNIGMVAPQVVAKCGSRRTRASRRSRRRVRTPKGTIAASARCASSAGPTIAATASFRRC